MGLLGMTALCPPLQLTYLPQPWGNCRAESGLGEPELQGYSAYSVSACRLRCEKEAVLQRCHCRMVHMPGGHPTLGSRTRGRALLMCTSRCMYTTCVRVYTNVSVHVLGILHMFHTCTWNAHMHVNMYLCIRVLVYTVLWT